MVYTGILMQTIGISVMVSVGLLLFVCCCFSFKKKKHFSRTSRVMRENWSINRKKKNTWKMVCMFNFTFTSNRNS